MRGERKTVAMAGLAVIVVLICFGPKMLHAQVCATSGAITADCTLNANTTGAITLGSGTGPTNMAIDSSITIGHTIDDDDATSDGFIFTDGSAITVNQTAAIGGTLPLAGFQVEFGDTWNTTADILTNDTISTIPIQIDGTLNIDASSNTITLATGGGTIRFQGIINVNDSTNLVTLANMTFGTGTALNLADTSNIDLGTLNGSGGTLTLGGSYATDNTIGQSLALGTINVNAGTFTVGHAVTANNINMADSTTLDITGGGTVSGFTLTGSSGVNTITLTNGALGSGSETYDLGGGNDVINNNGGFDFFGTTLNGGAGTDTINDDGGTYNVDIVNIENINATSDITFNGSVTGAAVTLTGSKLSFNGSGETFVGTVAGSAGQEDISIDDGTFSATSVDLGTGFDRVDVNAGTTTAGTWSGVETIHMTQDFTVKHAITGVDDADNTGVDVNGNLLTINSGGSIDGAIHDSSGSGFVEFGADMAGGTFNLGGIIEDVELDVTSGTVDTNGFALGQNSAIAGVATAAGGTLRAMDDITSNANLNNLGILFIGAGSTVSQPGMNVTNGTYTFEVDTSTSFGRLNVTGGAINLTGSTVTASVRSGTLADGDELQVGSGTAPVIGLTGAAGQVATAVTDNSALWDFQLADGAQAEILGSTDNTALFLLAEQVSTAAQNAVGGNNLAVGRIMDGLNGNTANPELLSVLNQLNNASNANEINDVLEASQPTVDGGHVVGSLNFMNSGMRIIRQQLINLRRKGGDSGLSSGNTYLSEGTRAWLQAFGQTADQDRRSGIAGYDADTYGMAVGVDRHNSSKNSVIGLALSYGMTEVDSNNRNRTNTDIDSYQVTVYGGFSLTNRLFMNGQIGYSFNDVGTRRRNVGGVAGLTANGDFHAHQFTARAELGREYTLGETVISPSVLTHWTHYDPERYRETDAGGAGLRVNGKDLDIFEVGVGIDAVWEHEMSSGSFLSPEVRASYRHDFIGDRIETTSRFTGGGGSFQTVGFNPARNKFTAGAGVTWSTTLNWELSANYDFEYKADYDSHSGFVRAAYRF